MTQSSSGSGPGPADPDREPNSPAGAASPQANQAPGKEQAEGERAGSQHDIERDAPGRTDREQAGRETQEAEGVHRRLDDLVRGEPDELPTPGEAAARDENDALGEP